MDNKNSCRTIASQYRRRHVKSRDDLLQVICAKQPFEISKTAMNIHVSLNVRRIARSLISKATILTDSNKKWQCNNRLQSNIHKQDSQTKLATEWNSATKISRIQTTRDELIDLLLKDQIDLWIRKGIFLAGFNFNSLSFKFKSHRD